MLPLANGIPFPRKRPLNFEGNPMTTETNLELRSVSESELQSVEGGALQLVAGGGAAIMLLAGCATATTAAVVYLLLR